LMLRSIDIPCRYVTGYVLDAPDDFESIPEEKAGDSIFIEGTPYEFKVQKRNSHAWVEVWFDDFGWLAFEPTTIYTPSFSYSEWNDSPEYKDIDKNSLTEQLLEPERPVKMLIVIFSSVLLLGAILAIFGMIYIEAHKANKEKVYTKWKNIRKIYQTSRKTKKTNETVMEFVQRVDKDNDDLLEAAKIFEIAAYSDKEITSEQIDEIESLYKTIRKTEGTPK